jgi:hypothetical protein
MPARENLAIQDRPDDGGELDRHRDQQPAARPRASATIPPPATISATAVPKSNVIDALEYRSAHFP